MADPSTYLFPSGAHAGRDDIYLKSLYFAIWAAVGAFWPYIYVYYRSDIGLSGTQIGMVVMISSLMGMVSATAWAC